MRPDLHGSPHCIAAFDLRPGETRSACVMPRFEARLSAITFPPTPGAILYSVTVGTLELIGYGDPQEERGVSLAEGLTWTTPKEIWSSPMVVLSFYGRSDFVVRVRHGVVWLTESRRAILQRAPFADLD